MPALAKGLMIEYVANKKGSVQFDSIFQPNQDADINERSDIEFLTHYLLFSVNRPSRMANFSICARRNFAAIK
jgi:hypothetical protein